MSLLSYEIEHFNPYSPRAHLTANIPCQLGDQPQVVCVDKSFHREPTEPKDRERAVRNSRTTSHFLRRLSLRPPLSFLHQFWNVWRDSAEPESHFFISGIYFGIAMMSAFGLFAIVSILGLFVSSNDLHELTNAVVPDFLLTYGFLSALVLFYWYLGKSRQKAIA